MSKTKYQIKANRNSKEHLAILIYKNISSEEKLIASSNFTPFFNKNNELNYHHCMLNPDLEIHKIGKTGTFEEVFSESYSFLKRSLLNDRKKNSLKNNLKKYDLECKIKMNQILKSHKKIIQKYHSH